MNHRWNKQDACINCGILREKRTIKTLMAITNSSPYNHYVYENKYHYLTGEKPATIIRPNCSNKKTWRN